ncbi:pseudouridine synthase [Vagococcus lutrae]|uniref:pseudouridine synthase n=1 Tax=Vagococcus lutrae TaxID=81947 RepID=UPI00200DD607|nr:pseudouridine synthase [Vagococcus lutrae]MDT2806823.1 pseudouridine synthase [Vagococcus lutrae]MDT2841837.1 pseudouridine synthase [Vagococcus lutrae]UQF18219.1 rRNA pseudouridine synthase [Vagococcus lutrae]
MRLDKLLSEVGYGSRKEVKQLLKKSHITVDGVRQRDGKYQVNPDEQVICVEGEQLLYEADVYLLLHKPMGVISATEDPRHRTVLDLLPADYQKRGIFPVGRLDKDTTGLLLLTNNGDLAHALLSPKKKVPKTYWAKIAGVVTEADVTLFKQGMTISGNESVAPAHLVIEEVDEQEQMSEIRLTITEGKFHQVKRMFEAVDKKVLLLHRETMGPLKLTEDLTVGTFRALTTAEKQALAII